MQQLIFGPTLFYDVPEYLQIVTTHPFLQVFSLGHFPIHPIFLGILWILIKFLPVNVIAMFFGVISIFIIYKISKLIFKEGPYFLATLIFTLFPAVWIINTNLMVESVALTFYLLSIYFFLTKKSKSFFLSLFLMIGIHIQTVFWIPTILLLPFIFNEETDFKKKEIFKYIKFSIFAILTSIAFYFLIYYFSGREISGTTEQLSTYLSSGILRMIRNSWLTLATDFGSLIIPILLIILIKKIKSKEKIIAWIIFFVLTILMAANWQGDFMGRRIIFASVILSLAIYKYLKRKTFFVILYLLPIVIANIVLYSGSYPFALPNIPKDQVLVETRYLKPFTKYDGTILWIGEDNLSKIDEFFKDDKRVFITKQAVTAPYLLLVGQNYHITSLGKIGESESRFLFKKYAFESHGNFLEIKKYNGNISKDAGEPIIFYDQNFWGRLNRHRIDYGDIGTWIWAIVTNHRDPTGWTYNDARGIWYNI